MKFFNHKSWKEALKFFTTCVQENIMDQNCWLKKGFCENALGNYQDAIQSYNYAIKIDSLSYNWALRLGPKSSATWNNKGLALYYLSKYSDAIKCYDQALEIDPTNSYAWNNKGIVLNLSLIHI
eukprot:TRINITY_DN3410_c0_g2_i2.p2 TRINITY_DN3410_c0_g2~~TRINITY_DN3410_c0_g2_i2.p2  ORF type:complete len:124 (-),score=10.78 TRINITY_DN3410_c0_g2_i2:101-472(-)